MSRRSMIFGLGILLLLVGVVGGVLVLLVRHEPGFYQHCAIPPGEERKANALAFQTKFTDGVFVPIAQEARAWGAKFTEKEINSYLQENMESHGYSKTLPKEISDPRIVIEQQKLRLAFRYGKDPWQTVITIDLHPYLVDEPNVVVLELLGLHAGLLPVNSQSILERISHIAKANHLELTWYRYKSNPVAVLRFQPGLQLKWLELQQGTLSINGDTSRSRAVLSTAPFAMPAGE